MGTGSVFGNEIVATTAIGGTAMHLGEKVNNNIEPACAGQLSSLHEI